MATTHSPLPSPLPPYPALSRLRETSPLERNGSTSSSRSTATVSSTTSSLVAVEMRPPPKETRTAASGAPTPGATTSSSDSDQPDVAGPSRRYHPSPPEGVYGGRGFQRNGPRSSTSSPSIGGIPSSTSAPNRRLPAIVTDQGTPPPRPTSSHVAGSGISPTTPRAGRFFTRPISSELGGGSDDGERMLASPAASSRLRTSSAGGPGEAWERERERRQSVASAKSAASVATAGTVTSQGGGRMRETTADYVFGEELGRGSYSTVVHAVRVTSPTTSSPISRPPRQFAVKIINQAHLIQERKTKYAMIERDALVRLNAPRVAGGAPSSKGHKRGMSGSSTPGTPSQTPMTTRAIIPISSEMSIPANKTTDSANSSYAAPSSMSSLSTAAPLASPTLSTSASTSTSGTTLNLGMSRNGRRPSRSADPPEVVPERSDEGHEEPAKSRPVSPVVEDKEGERYFAPDGARQADVNRISGERVREKSTELAKRPASRVAMGQKEGSKDRSRRSGVGKGAHPGIIKLYSTFNDVTSLYFVLELAGKGELLTYLRKFGSLDVDSARYYSALLLDTVEFMHERGVVHRDLKPENILLDDEMRLKITDFGSAKLVDKEGKDPKDSGDGPEAHSKKRSFVGSADFVSPEVLRNEPALAASDVWAFGCIVYQLIVGKPPFRGATDYLTFQKILKREMDFPEGFDADARSLVEVILNLDPAARPNPSDLKVHPFFSSIDWRTLWHSPAAPMSTGITPPVVTLASVDPASDIWAVFEDEMSDNGVEPDVDVPNHHSTEPRYDRHAAAQAVWAVDSPDADPRGNPLEKDEDLEPPRPAWMEAGQRKLRALSKGSSARTSSSSSGNRTALTGLLETMGIVSASGGAGGSGSGRTSRASGSIKEAVEPREKMDPTGRRVSSPGISTGQRQRHEAPQRSDSRWNQLLLTNETILLTSPITLRTSSSTSLLPSFLSPSSARRRQLLLTDLPRMFTVKEESPGAALQTATSLAAASQASLSVKNECVFVSGSGGGEVPGPHCVVDISEKGARGFTVQTPSQTFSYVADTAESRCEWMSVLRQVMDTR